MQHTTRRELDDSAVIDAALRGDQQVYEILVRKYRDHAFSLALRIVKSRE